MKTHQIYRVFLFAALLQFITFISSAQVTMYANIKGQKSGEIKGNVTTKGLEGAIECIGFSLDDLSPRDPQTGMLTGKKMHKPIEITTEFDNSTLQLLNVLYTNENLQQVVIRFFRPNATGLPTNFATITLTNANIMQIDQSFEKFAATAAATVDKEKPFKVKIALTYQKIEFSQGTSGNITASDSWTSTN